MNTNHHIRPPSGALTVPSDPDFRLLNTLWRTDKPEADVQAQVANQAQIVFRS
jgi:hypothetical protein